MVTLEFNGGNTADSGLSGSGWRDNPLAFQVLAIAWGRRIFGLIQSGAEECLISTDFAVLAYGVK
jgi:hypothetical protein